MIRAFLSGTILLLIPVAVYWLLNEFDLSFRIGEYSPRQLIVLEIFHFAFGMLAMATMAMSVRRNWGDVSTFFKSISGAVCGCLALACLLAWIYCMLFIPFHGLWYDLP